MLEQSTIAPPEPRPVTGQDSLSNALQARFETWLNARKPQEEKLLAAYSDAMRISRDDDVKDTGAAKAQKSKLFVGSTRSKIRSARAKIKDSLFGSGKMPFDTNPTNEKLKKYADVVEEILTFQFKDMKFRGMLGGGINSLCTYGTAMLYGPFERTKHHVSADLVPGGADGQMVLGESKQPYRCPYFEHGATMDAYPDPEAPGTDGLGLYWSSWKQPHEVRSWAGNEGYNAEAIEYAVTQLSTNSSSEGQDRAVDQRANVYRFSKDGRVRVLRYFGLVRAEELAEWQKFNREENIAHFDSPDDMVETVIIMAGGVVIKAEPNPYKGDRRPAYRCVYEEVEHEFWGVGIAENNEPHQKVVNAAFRLYVEGKAFALLKTCSIDRSKFEEGEDFAMFPGKRYKMRPGLTPDERKTAIIWHDMHDVTDGWENVIELSERFSDDDTGITKYSQGSDSSHLNNTATGISMIMNASSLPMKEVIQNVDEMWIENAVESLIEWNLANLEPETVAMLLGDEQARVWAEVQKFGKTSFMIWKATGSSTFMVKEILMQKLQGFLQLVVSTPSLEQLVDVRELLEQVWDSGEIGKESPIFSEEDVKSKQGAGKLPPEIEQALAKQEELLKKYEAEAASRDHETQVSLAKIASDERLKTQEMLIKDRDSRVRAEKDLAGVELVEAQTVKTLAEAGVTPAPAMVAMAAGWDPKAPPEPVPPPAPPPPQLDEPEPQPEPVEPQAGQPGEPAQ